MFVLGLGGSCPRSTASWRPWAAIGGFGDVSTWTVHPRGIVDVLSMFLGRGSTHSGATAVRGTVVGQGGCGLHRGFGLELQVPRLPPL